MKNKVYCKDCDYFDDGLSSLRTGIRAKEKCIRFINIESYKSKNDIKIKEANPVIKNKKNNCSDFKKKRNIWQILLG